MSVYKLTDDPHGGIIYAAPSLTLLLPSELAEIILTHIDAWQVNRERLLMALRLREGGS